MAIVYYPKGSVLVRRDTISSSFEELVLNISPDTILFFNTGSGVVQFPIHADSSSFASSSISSSVSSLSITSSYTIGIPSIKSGIISGSLFNNPGQKIYDVVFTQPFKNDNYSVTVTGEIYKNWRIENRTSAGFTINTGNNGSFTEFVYWQAIESGEFYN